MALTPGVVSPGPHRFLLRLCQRQALPFPTLQRGGKLIGVHAQPVQGHVPVQLRTGGFAGREESQPAPIESA
jgi:hypothetical protein